MGDRQTVSVVVRNRTRARETAAPNGWPAAKSATIGISLKITKVMRQVVKAAPVVLTNIALARLPQRDLFVL